MLKQGAWVWDRPLYLDESLFISRKNEVDDIVTKLTEGIQIFFVWSLPKSGTTTFFSELAALVSSTLPWQVIHLDVREESKLQQFSSISTDKQVLVILDELEEISKEKILKIFESTIETKNEKIKWILSGDRRVLELAESSLFKLSLNSHLTEDGKVNNITELELSTMLTENVANHLVVEPFSSLGIAIEINVALELCREAGGNLYLIQRLANFLYEFHGGHADVITMASFQGALNQASLVIQDYFDDLARMLFEDKVGLYQVIDSLDDRCASHYVHLHGLPIISNQNNDFISGLYKKALKKRCLPRNIADQYFKMGYFEKALEFYEVHLKRWCHTDELREDALDHLLSISYDAGQLEKYISFASQFVLITREDRRQKWIESTFIPQVVELLNSLYEKDAQLILNTICESVNILARTDRIRLYLLDATEEKLICRIVIGIFKEEFLKDDIILNDTFWKIREVYYSQLPICIDDCQKDSQCNHTMASRYEVNSSWLFPIMLDSDKKSENHQCIGVLCIDNPSHVVDKPGNTEWALIEQFLSKVAKPVFRSMGEANRIDLQKRLHHLTKLSEYLLKHHNEKEIMRAMFAAAVAIVPSISMINVRMIRGFKEERLEVVDSWPEIVAPLFEDPELKIIDIKDSFAEKENRQPMRYIKDVQAERKQLIALDKFLDKIKENNINVSVKSLLSFRMEYGNKYLGMCNFYTGTTRAFPDDDRKILAMIVRHVTVSLFNARRIYQMERQRKSLEILSYCIRQVNAMISPDALIDIITQKLGELFDVYSSTWISVDSSNKLLYIMTTWPKDAVTDKDKKTLEWGEAITGQAILIGVPYVLSERDKSEWDKHYYGIVPGIKCCASVPVKDDADNVIAALTLETRTEDAFTPEDIRLISLIIQQVYVVMTNAKLVDELNRNNERLLDAHERLKDDYWMKAMGETVGAVVHRMAHFTNPIQSAAEVSLELLRDSSIQIDHDIIEILIDLKNYGKQLQELISKFKESISPVKKIENVDLKSLVEEISYKIDKDFKWIIIIPDGSVLLTEKLKLQLIIECVMENALYAAKRAFQKDSQRRLFVCIKSEMNGKFHCIDITDSGRGIPEKLQHELFRHIVQSNQQRGNGFGLFISNQLAVRLNGKLCVYESTENGTTFRLLLPVEIKEGEFNADQNFSC